MNQYKITKYSYDRAKQLNVNIYPSSNKKYKIDVYDKNDHYITSIGQNGALDYPNYLLLEYNDMVPEGHADMRRALYRIRHKKDLNIKGSRGYYSNKILW